MQCLRRHQIDDRGMESMEVKSACFWSRTQTLNILPQDDDANRAEISPAIFDTRMTEEGGKRRH